MFAENLSVMITEEQLKEIYLTATKLKSLQKEIFESLKSAMEAHNIIFKFDASYRPCNCIILHNKINFLISYTDIYSQYHTVGRAPGRKDLYRPLLLLPIL